MTGGAAEHARARTLGIVIASTRASAGIYADECAPLIREWAVDLGFTVPAEAVVPDGPAVLEALRELLAARPSVIVTSGGTGLNPDDVTPELTAGLIDRPVPGVMEAIRAAGLRHTPMAALSRGVAGAAGSTFIVNLPGSPKAVLDGLAVLAPLLPHLCEQLEGKRGHEGAAHEDGAGSDGTHRERQES